MAAGLGFFEILFILASASGGQSNDMVSMIDAESYFKWKNTPVTISKMMELAAADPTDAKAQLGQLLALRTLAERAEQLKKDANFPQYRQTLEAIAKGNKAQDELGFARDYAHFVLNTLDGKSLTQKQRAPLEGLTWFPARCTFVGGLDARNIEPANSSGVQELRRTLFGKIPPMVRDKVFEVAEQIGNAELNRVCFGYEEQPAKDGRRVGGPMWVRFTGRMPHQRVVKAIESNAGNDVVIEKKKSDAGAITFVKNPNPRNEPAVAFLGDTDVLLAFDSRNNNDNWATLEEALKMRAEKAGKHAANGNLKSQLGEVSKQACAFLVGDVPEDIRNLMKGQGGPFGGAFPRAILGQMRHSPVGFDFDVKGSLDTPEDTMKFVQGVTSLRKLGIQTLKNLQGGANLPPQVPVDALIKTMESIQIQGQGNEAQFRMLISNDVLNSIPAFLLLGRIGILPPVELSRLDLPCQISVAA